MRQTNINARRLGLAALLGMGLLAAPAFAVDTSQCDSVSDPMQRAQCRCSAAQAIATQQTAAIIPQQADSNPYLQKVQSYQPGDNSTLGVAGVSQSCNGMTKSAFDSVLNSFGNFLGFDVSSVLGPVANAAQSSVCQSINNAIMQRTTIQCPSVSIPGFPMACQGSASVGANGLQFGGSSAFGGVATGGNSTVGLGSLAGGVGSAGSYLGGATGAVGGTSVGGVSGGVVNPTSAPASSGGVVNSVTSAVSCWISGNC